MLNSTPQPARVLPVIDRNRCEGKGECILVCPYNVFEMGTLDAQQKKSLSWRGRIKLFAHGNIQAFVLAPQDCHACGECVKGCPEAAISLQVMDPTSGTA